LCGGDGGWLGGVIEWMMWWGNMIVWQGWQRWIDIAVLPLA
jgi:hypothetical protein